MNFLPTHTREIIDRYDWTNHRSKPYPQFSPVNRTRFYKYLLPAGNDMEVHTVAVKTRKDRTVAIKEVVRASVDDPFQYIKDVACLTMGGYVVDFSPDGIGRPKEWSYRGSWQSEAWGIRCKWKIQCQVINPEALRNHPRFQYCAWTPECGDILDYLKTYIKHPKIELLSKIGASRFATRPGFIAQLERDKGLMRYFMANLPDIQERWRKIDAIRIAYKTGITMDEADTRIKARHAFKGQGLPLSVDAVKALAYVRYDSKWEYCQYLRNCITLGMDLADTKVTFPKQFKQRRTIVADRIAELDRLKDVEKAKALNAQIKEAAEKWIKLETRKGALLIVLPRKANDFKAEGKRLRNCLGDGHYAQKMARGETVTAFVRKANAPRKPFVAVEYSPSEKRIRQCYGANNAKPPAPVLEFVEKVFKKAKVAA